MKGGWDVETQMHKGQEQEGDDRWGLGLYRAAVLPLPLLVAFGIVSFGTLAFDMAHHSATPGTGAAVCVCGEGTGAIVRTRAGEGTDARKKCTWRLFLFFFFPHKS